jgi:hypothetical protein
MFSDETPDSFDGFSYAVQLQYPKINFEPYALRGLYELYLLMHEARDDEKEIKKRMEAIIAKLELEQADTQPLE